LTLTTRDRPDAPHEPFRLEQHPDGERVRLAPAGELDLATAGQVGDALSAAAADFKEVVLDLRAVRFMDSSGLRLILLADAESRRDGFSFSLIEGPPAVQRIFSVAGVLDRLEFRAP
jgi:anti-anti-sigma factor